MMRVILTARAAQSPALGSKRIIVFSADEPDKKANAALLMALYAVSRLLSAVNCPSNSCMQMIVLRWSPADALHPIASLELVRSQLYMHGTS